MAHKRRIVTALVLIWIAIFIASYVMSTRIEGPRNLDTGFARLDVLVRYQLVAFSVAVISAIAGILWRQEGGRIMVIGLAPLILTILLVAALFAGTMIFNSYLAPQEAHGQPTGLGNVSQ